MADVAPRHRRLVESARRQVSESELLAHAAERATEATDGSSSNSDDDGGGGGDSPSPRWVRSPTMVLAWLLLAAMLASQPPGRRVPATVDLAVTCVAFCLEYSLLVFPLVAQALCWAVRLCPRGLARAAAKLAVHARLHTAMARAHRLLLRVRRSTLEGASLMGLVCVLLLPLLSGTPVPITVLMESAWAPQFAAGDVLLSSAKVSASAGAWVMYKDAANAASLRSGNASTALGLLAELRCGADGTGLCARGQAGPPASSVYPLKTRSAAGSWPTHALVLRRARTERSGPPGAPGGACPAGVPLPARPEGAAWECAPVPLGALLAVVAVRVPRAAWPAVPFFALRRRLLECRPPLPPLAPQVAHAAQNSRIARWLRAAEANAAAKVEAKAARLECGRLTALADAAQMRAAAASFWQRAALTRAAQIADQTALEGCARLKK